MGISLGSVVFVVAVLLLFGQAILNGYGKGRIERAFARAHPGWALRIGELHYAVGANRLVAQSATLSTPNATLQAGRISLTGVRWAQLLRGSPTLTDILAQARLDTSDLRVEFAQSLYMLRCARLRASVPDSELIAEGAEFRPLVGDGEFFAAHTFRTTRYQVLVPECHVTGMAFGELFQGTAWRAGAIHFSRPTFDALVNCDQPPPPFVKRPLMVHEGLAALGQPLQVDRLSLTNGHLTYREQMVAGAAPGVLTFGDIHISAEGLANRGEATAAIRLRGQGEFMNAGTLKVQLTIPISPPDFSLHYSGSLGAMDLTRLNAFLEEAEYIRVKSGRAQEAAFEIEVTAGQARGRVRAIYGDLKVAMLDEQTGTETGFNNRLASFVANMRTRNASAPDAAGETREGRVNYTRKPEDKFLPFVWQALRGGVMDVISH